jgi:arabinose-5-phosphate isomerase
VGIITDGDLRRMLENGENLNTITAKDIYSPTAKTIEPEALAVDALDLLRKNDISQLIVTKGSAYAGMLHLHDLVREGIV